MGMKTLTKMVTLTVALGFLAVPVLADRAPSAQEWQRVVSQLSSLGFTSWKEIEWDDGYWEVDNAIGPDGVEYDLKLDPETLAVVEQERD
jgi:hypothetical protein